MPNERRDFTGLKVFMKSEKDNEYGVTTILGFEDTEGNCLIWFATGSKAYEIGQVLNLKATIKGYDESDGVKKTVITRAREIEEKKMWSPCAVGITHRARRR